METYDPHPSDLHREDQFIQAIKLMTKTNGVLYETLFGMALVHCETNVNRAYEFVKHLRYSDTGVKRYHDSQGRKRFYHVDTYNPFSPKYLAIRQFVLDGLDTQGEVTYASIRNQFGSTSIRERVCYDIVEEGNAKITGRKRKKIVRTHSE